MKITVVRFRRLQSHDRGYGHDAVEAEAQVEDGETPEEAIDTLKGWVAAQLSHLKKTSELTHSLTQLMTDVKYYEGSLARVQQQIEYNRKILREHDKLAELARANGLDFEADQLDGIPF